MNQIQAHYENLLAAHYTWMFGDYMSKVRENVVFFEQHQILPHKNARAIDLGCGCGFQSVALADLGFKVLSIDFSQALLEELKKHQENRSISIVNADLLDFNQYYSYEAPELIICMGDTLTHLNSLETIVTLLQNAVNTLEANGHFILTYRDMTQELNGLDRFIPVRSDENKIMTAFLEYWPNYVLVHDLIYTRSGTEWILHKSSYKKLRISKHWLKEQFTALGMKIECEETHSGFTVLIAAKN